MDTVCLEFEPTMVHLPFPYDFYSPRQKQIGNSMDLVDDHDHVLSIPLVYGDRKVVMWQVIEEIKKFYGIHKTLLLYLKYEGGKRFRFQIMDEESNETLTPTLVNPSVRPSGNNHEVIDISSDSSGDVHGNVNVGSTSRVNRSGHVRRSVNVGSESCSNRFDDVRRRMRVMTFEKIISKSQAKAGQTLPMPRKFVQGFIQKRWKKLILQIGGGRTYHCTLLWRKDGLKDCHLGKCWYKLVSDMRLSRGDKVVFETIMKDLNRVNVRIIRMGD